MIDKANDAVGGRMILVGTLKHYFLATRSVGKLYLIL
jgi:hypothetical protein